MSTHVCSRWYRSPEICILENHYDQASDIWSLGCCLYELMKVVGQDSSSKTALFKGKHCFPLSPAANDNEDEALKDQMAIILNKSGKMTDYDLSFVRSTDALDYIQGLNVGPDT